MRKQAVTWRAGLNNACQAVWPKTSRMVLGVQMEIDGSIDLSFGYGPTEGIFGCIERYNEYVTAFMGVADYPVSFYCGNRDSYATPTVKARVDNFLRGK